MTENNQKVSERTLERLAAGALDEETTAQVMAQLEAEPGGIERLEALIQENEAFFEAHPPEEFVPRIRGRYDEEMRAERAGARSLRSLYGAPPPMPLALALVLFMVGSAWLWVRDANEPGDTPPPQARAVEPEAGQPDEEQALGARSGDEQWADEEWDREPLVLGPFELSSLGEGVRRVVVAEESVARAEFVEDIGAVTLRGIREGETAVEVEYDDGRFERFLLRIEVPDGDYRPYDIGMAPGERRQLGRQGVVRVATQDDRVVHIEIDEDSVILEAQAVGVTMAFLSERGRERPHSLRIYVGELVAEAQVEAVVSTGRAALAGCDRDGAGGRAEVVALVAADGAVPHAFAEEYSVSAEVLSCVVEAVRAWEFPGHDDEVERLARFGVEL